MRIGVIKEIKNRENRVALTPDGVSILSQSGHEVFVEQNAGDGSGFTDNEYTHAGASIVPADQAWATDLVLKVKEPQPQEYDFLNGQIVFTFFHLAGVDRALTETLLKSNTTAVAYESVEDKFQRLPLLAPMSGVAGSMAVTMGNYYLAHFNEGRGTLLGDILGQQHGKVVIIGDGIVGQHAGRVASGMGAEVVIMGINPDAENTLKTNISERIRYLLSEPETIASETQDADLVVGAVLLRNAKAPYVMSEKMVANMRSGAVIVDVSIDQGGCVETSRPTSHTDPVFQKHGVTHYCVTNMPGAYPRTSTLALTTATMPYIHHLADEGIEALKRDRGFARGVNIWQGKITCKPVANALRMEERYLAFE